MTDLRQAVQMALEALQCSLPFHETVQRLGAHNKAITALRERLEQPKGLFIDMIAAQGPEFVEEVRRVGENIEQQAEPVAWVFAPNNELLWPSEVEVTNPIEIDSYQPLYTSPPQRKPLTTDERGSIVNEALRGHASTRDAIDWAIRHVERHHGIGETP